MKIHSVKDNSKQITMKMIEQLLDRLHMLNKKFLPLKPTNTWSTETIDWLKANILPINQHLKPNSLHWNIFLPRSMTTKRRESTVLYFIYPVTDQIDYCCKRVSTISGLNNVNFDQQIKRHPKHKGVAEVDYSTIKTLPNLSFPNEPSLYWHSNKHVVCYFNFDNLEALNTPKNLHKNRESPNR